jgi:hypothetical protein
MSNPEESPDPSPNETPGAQVPTKKPRPEENDKATSRPSTSEPKDQTSHASTEPEEPNTTNSDQIFYSYADRDVGYHWQDHYQPYCDCRHNCESSRSRRSGAMRCRCQLNYFGCGPRCRCNLEKCKNRYTGFVARGQGVGPGNR